MAYELTKNSINSFNRQYGTSISFGDIKSQAKKLGSYNQALRAVFLEAYKQVALKDLIDHDTDFLKSHEMFQDFNQWITNSLIDETPLSRRDGLSKNMGVKSQNEAYEMLEATWAELPKNQVDAVMENYLKGNIRIRDMRAYAESCRLFDDKRAQTELASYAMALKQVNEARPRWWRILHPFRNNAEKRDSKIIENLLRTSIGFAADKVFTKALDSLINFNDLENKTISNVRDNDNLIEEDFVFNPDEINLEDKYDKEYLDTLNETEKQKLMDNIKRERYNEYQLQQASKREREFKEFLKKMNSEDNKLEENEAKKDNIILAGLKEDIYANNEDNNVINEVPVIQNPDANLNK